MRSFSTAHKIRVKVAQYSLPRMENIHAKLAGGQSFTELDLSHAYEQIKLDDQSQ